MLYLEVKGLNLGVMSFKILELSYNFKVYTYPQVFYLCSLQVLVVSLNCTQLHSSAINDVWPDNLLIHDWATHRRSNYELPKQNLRHF